MSRRVSFVFASIALLAAVACRDDASRSISGIINVHEHIQSTDEIDKLLGAMDRVGVRKTVLVGSSWFTITLNPRIGFSRYDENNESLLRAVERHPGRFEAWPTMDPKDPEKLETFKRLVERGATGLKLYLGHGYAPKGSSEYFFHTMAMDDPRMFPVYRYLVEKNLPVLFHVNPSPTKPGFAEEFVAVLTQFPSMKVIAPHFILSSIKDTRLREFLDTFPNLYTDISFGYDAYLEQGLLRVSKNPNKYRRLFEDYSDRFMFGTDVVVTKAAFKTEAWIATRYQAYVDMLTKMRYETAVVPQTELNGLALPQELAERVLWRNYEAFKAKKPKDVRLTAKVNWERMGLSPTGRKPGTTIPIFQPLLPKLEKQALQDPTPGSRTKAVYELARLRDKGQVVEILAEVLRTDPDVGVREDALSALEDFDEVPMEPVLAVALSDPVPSMRLLALEVVEDQEWRSAEVLQTLERALDDPDPEVRFLGLEILGDLGAWDVLRNASRTHLLQEVREEALRLMEDR